jgi:excisionase family DNA binding protein
MSKKSVSAVPNPEDFLMSIPTAAQRMSTTVFAIRELCRAGELKYIAIGHRWLISPEAIANFIRRKEREVPR